MTQKFNTEILRYIAALEQSSGAEVRDCIINENAIVYVVKKGHLGRAIGKKGMISKTITKNLGKTVKIVEFAENPAEFVENLLSSFENKKVRIEEREGAKTIFIKTDQKTRGAIVGREGKNIEIVRELVRRHYNIASVIVE